MTNSKEFSEEKILYIMGWISIFFILIFFLILHILNFDIFNVNIPCAIYEKTGYYCPGCGMTRAIKALLSGDILASLKYHPIVVYLIGIGSIFMILNTISLISKKDFSGMRLKNCFILIIPIIIAVQWVIKNALLIIWGIRII